MTWACQFPRNAEKEVKIISSRHMNLLTFKAAGNVYLISYMCNITQHFVSEVSRRIYFEKKIQFNRPIKYNHFH